MSLVDERTDVVNLRKFFFFEKKAAEILHATIVNVYSLTLIYYRKISQILTPVFPYKFC